MTLIEGISCEAEVQSLSRGARVILDNARSGSLDSSQCQISGLTIMTLSIPWAGCSLPQEVLVWNAVNYLAVLKYEPGNTDARVHNDESVYFVELSYITSLLFLSSTHCREACMA